jgi:hypothetical protein
VYAVNGPEELPTLTVIANPLQLFAGMWLTEFASQYTKPSIVPATDSGRTPGDPCAEGTVILRFGTGIVGDTWAATPVQVKRITKMKYLKLRMSSSPIP